MNEFVARNGLIALDSSSISGPFVVTGSVSISGSITSSDMLIRGSGATNPLAVQDSLSNNLFRVASNALVFFGNATNRPWIGPVNGISSTNVNGTALQLLIDNSTTRTATGFDFLIRSDARDFASGTVDVLRLTAPFTPTSGTGVFNNFTINPTINQTGGANGITRGLYINPTITAAADFRSIEWSTNAATSPSQSWGLYGAGTVLH